MILILMIIIIIVIIIIIILQPNLPLSLQMLGKDQQRCQQALICKRA